MTTPTIQKIAEGQSSNPCGGCGATKYSERCIGCLHDFGTPESAWVKKYDPSYRKGQTQ